jgi:DNA ligase-1
MKRFSALLERLYYEHSNLGKEKLLCEYFSTTPDPDRGYALAIIAGTLDLPNFKRGMVLDLVRSRVDPNLLAMSYDYVGELSETVAHLWPGEAEGCGQLPLLHQLVEKLQHMPKAELPDYVASLLDCMSSPERWALLKIGSGSLRIGVSARFVKQVLAKFGNKPIEDIESLWHGVEAPYTSLFAWLEGKEEAPAVTERLTFSPVMLAHPLEEKDYARITPDAYAAEWKYDGIRVQLVHNHLGKALFTRTGDDIGHAFPDVLEHMNFHGTVDGELIVKTSEGIGSFNALQQRLNRKSPTAKLIATYPTGIIANDLLALEGGDLRGLPYDERRRILEQTLATYQPFAMELSPQVPFTDFADLAAKRDACATNPAYEGVMLKRRDSTYVAGRPTGPWYKWKSDPRLVDAVLMYAQRGSGKRSSYYSDYTFGLWKDDTLLPIGKAYFGFTDEELKKLDHWVRNHTQQSFGPVREVEKELVFEVAFDSVNRSARHKSGFALRFPRIHRIRWDKPAREADRLELLETML